MKKSTKKRDKITPITKQKPGKSYKAKETNYDFRNDNEY